MRAIHYALVMSTLIFTGFKVLGLYEVFKVEVMGCSGGKIKLEAPARPSRHLMGIALGVCPLPQIQVGCIFL